METLKVGTRGTVVIPRKLRKRFHLAEGSTMVAEEREEGILLRPAVVLPVETYSPERVAEFHLNNAADAKDYAWALKEVRRMGLDPARIPHSKPPGA